MDAAAHTPGPWVFVQDGLTLVRGVSDDDCHQVVADCASDFMTNAECEANARLIAAAPDMLKALHKMVNAVGSRPTISVDEADAIAKAAIAKAEAR
jgi:hypothetical protein